MYFTNVDILLGIDIISLEYLNIIFAVAKKYIWRCKLEKKHPILKGYLYILNQYMETEYHIATKNE